MKLFVTESAQTSVRYKTRLTIQDISEWNKFQEVLGQFPMDEVIPIKIQELKIKVKGKRVIPENEPPTGLLRTLFDNLVRSFVSIALPSKRVSEKVKSIARCSFQDMLNVERTSVLQVLLRIGLWPFKNWGLLALLTAPVYTCVMAPACSLIFAVYCLPTIYLTYRLFYHARNKIDYKEQKVDDESPLITRKPSVVKIKKIKKNITKIDKTVHKRLMSISENEEHIFPCTWGSGTIYNLRRFMVQILVGVFCVSCLYSFILLAVEATGIFVEIMAFTMMGIIVNAGSTLRYVSMALLVLVYMHDCYNNVYESYLTFNKAVIDDIMDRVEDLKTVASLPSSMQESIGFTVKPVEAVDRIPTAFMFDKTEPRWRIGHLFIVFGFI
ncbi:unnamed protein product [Mytilus edulis]|nr:unnamed protein product [Mytilus edulis]